MMGWTDGGRTGRLRLVEGGADRIRQIGKWLACLCFEKPGRRWLLHAVVMFAILLPVYGFLAVRLVDHANPDWTTSDQDSNLNLTGQSRDDWWPHRSDFVQPLFPWVASRGFVDDPAVQFVRGKWINLGFGALLTIGVILGSARFLPGLPAFVVSSGVMLGVILQRFHYYQPEPFYYAAFGLAFFGMSASLFRNSWWIYAGTGLALGLAYLAKGGADPLIACFFGATVLRILGGRVPGWGGGSWSVAKHAVGILIAVVVFAGIYAPMAAFNVSRFGDAFHSLPRYWMWMKLPDQQDKNLQVMLLYQASRDQIPADEFPGAANYFRRYGWADAGERLAGGIANVWGWFILPNRHLNATLGLKPTRRDKETNRRYWKTLLPARGLAVSALALAAGVLLAGVLRSGKLADLGAAAVFAWIAMAAVLFAGYLVLFGWYAEIGRGERFILTLQIPLLCGLAWLCDRLQRVHRGAVGGWIYGCVLLAITGHTLAQIGALILHPWFDI